MKRIAFLCAAAFACAALAGAADTPADAAMDQRVVGTWQGSLSNGMGSIRVVLKVDRTVEGALKATMDSPDQNASGIPVAGIKLEGQTLTLDVAAVGGSYEGTLDAAKDEVSGTWKQNGLTLPLVLKKDVPAK